MSIKVRKYKEEDLPQMRTIWNAVVEEGIAFPQEKILTLEEAKSFFAEQTYVGVADDHGETMGLYILHPNNVGRCSHIANTSYAVKEGQRGKHIGGALVKDSLKMAAYFSFRILQFNAVVASNAAAIHLYQKLGFCQVGVIPGGFRKKDGSYADIIIYYIAL